VVGENRKVLVFPLDELPEMTRGKGVRLQKYKDGGLSDATTFTLAEGLSWLDPAGRTRTEKPTSPNGWASAPARAAWRRAASRATTASPELRRGLLGPSATPRQRDRACQTRSTFSQTPPSGRVVRIITGLGSRPGTGVTR
jgi:DNA gyrase/topoisomerase IV subunit A